MYQRRLWRYHWEKPECNRSVKAEVGTEEVSIDLYTIIEYGQPIQKVASEVQENVRKSIEAMTGLKVVRVDVHVQGVSFEQEKRETQTNLEAVKRQHLPDSHQEKAKEDKKADRKKTKEAANDKPAADEAVQDTKQDQPAVADDSVTNEQPEQMVPQTSPLLNLPKSRKHRLLMHNRSC